VPDSRIVVLNAAIEDTDERGEARECDRNFREGLEQILVFQLASPRRPTIIQAAALRHERQQLALHYSSVELRANRRIAIQAVKSNEVRGFVRTTSGVSVTSSDRDEK